MSRSLSETASGRADSTRAPDASVVVHGVSKRYLVRDAKSVDASAATKKSSTMAVESLRNISLVAESGESIGLIGRNGSGKSTLMRIIAGGESPTEGSVFVKAQPTLLGVSPALQHYLTGEQNIYLGCLAIGMSKEEAKEAVPQIAEWADIGDAIKRPMSTYSAGQGARLSFAISTSINPEILLIDEALSTGDAAFARKAEQRMKELLGRAGNLFLVSHTTGQIEENCERAIWLHQGVQIADGPSSEVVSLYNRWTNHSALGKHEMAADILNEATSTFRPQEIILKNQS